MNTKQRAEYIQSVKSIVGDTITGAARGALVEITTKLIHLNDNVVSYDEMSNDENVSIRAFGNDGDISLCEPRYFDRLPKQIDNILGYHEYSRPYILDVPNVIVHSPEGQLQKAENKQYIVYNYGNEGNEDAARSLASDIVIGLGHGSVPPVLTDNDDIPRYDLAISLLSLHASNYTHWTQECLTRLEALDHYVEQTGKHPTLLLPPDPQPFVSESLSLMGYNDHDFVKLKHSPVHIDQLLIPSPRRFLNNRSGGGWLRMPEAFEWVSDRATENISRSSTQLSSHVLISREDAATRRMTNRGEVADQLSEYDFEKYVLGTMSYEEQVRLFSQAEFVVGAHGAGMINCIYANNTPVLELYGDHFLPANYELAQGQNRPYGCLHCDPVGKDFHVNTDKLEEAVKSLKKSGQDR